VLLLIEKINGVNVSSQVAFSRFGGDSGTAIFNSGNIAKKSWVAGGSRYLQDMSFSARGSSSLTGSAPTAQSIVTDDIYIATYDAPTVVVSTNVLKRFGVSVACDTTIDTGRISVKCYNSAGTELTNGVNNYISGFNTWDTLNFGGNYRNESDIANNLQLFAVSAEVKSIRVIVEATKLESFSIITYDYGIAGISNGLSDPLIKPSNNKAVKFVIDADYTILPTDGIIAFTNNFTATRSVTLPSVSASLGKVFLVKAPPNAATFSLTVVGNIEGGNFVLNANNSAVEVYSEGSVWKIRSTVGFSASNLALGTTTATTQPITNSNGTGFTLPAVTTSVAGLMTAADKTTFNAIPTTYAPINSGSANYVLKAGGGTGGVMTGYLSIRSGSDTVPSLSLGNAGGFGWGMLERATDGNFQMAAFNGGVSTPVYTIVRSSGILNFTTAPTVPTQTAGDSTTKVASTAFVTTANNLKANIASPTFTGTPAAPTAAALTNTTQIATTAFVTTANALKADLASPTFTGTPTLPTGTIAVTQAAGDNTTKIATTAHVKDTFNRATGWGAYFDTVYTSGSPLSVAAAATVTLTNNAGTSTVTQLPTGVTNFYDSATSKITPQNVGDYYNITIRFKAKNTEATGGYFDFGIDLGGSIGVTFKESKLFVKGAGVEQNFTLTANAFVGATFLANGGIVKITGGNGTTTIYDIDFHVNRTHKAK